VNRSAAVKLLTLVAAAGAGAWVVARFGWQPWPVRGVLAWIALAAVRIAWLAPRPGAAAAKLRALVDNVLKLTAAAGLVWFVIDKAGWENVRDRLTNIDRETWILGLGALFVGTCVSFVRWHLLLHSVGLDTSMWTVFRLSWIGNFSNNVLPGLTGGDLVKAFYVTREHPRQRTDAVISVIVDRIIGIVALALIAAVVIPFDFERYHQVALAIYGFLAATGLGAVMVLSRRVKARLRLLMERLGRKPRGEGEGLSMLGKIDRATSMYRHRLGTIFVALAMSVVVHMLLIVGIWLFGAALSQGRAAGMPVDGAGVVERQHELDNLRHLGITTYCSIVPIIMIISSLPIAPAGWGVGEQAFVYFFGTVGVAAADATALSLTYRLTATLISLLGGVFLVFDRRRVMAELPAEGAGAS
jgi:uncharacterized protein (TIRG00374 family)